MDTIITELKRYFSLMNFVFCFIIFFAPSLLSQPNIPLDVSGMFNERGFLKSGSVSPDEGEMINNFNGNLCYTFPMFNLKGPGDIHLDLSLNYNGSVNYQVIPAHNGYLPGNYLPRHNVSAPGWILSLNGMAVQMLNFESNFFSTPNSGDSIVNSKVRLLAMGYHLTDDLQSISSGMHDVITLMRGDGSAVYLKRISDYCPDDDNFAGCYVGDYYVDGLGDYSRAKVEFIENASYPSYRNRRVSFMKGDGLTYVYEEYKNQYADFTYNTTSSVMFKPQVFLLKAVKDRFGNQLVLSYDYSIYFGGAWQPVYGRPVIKSIVGSWPGSSVSLNYVVNGNLAVTLNSNGNIYKILCADQAANFDSLGNHRYYPTSLVNPVNASTYFNHLTYSRFAYNMYNPFPNHQPTKMALNNDDGVKRLRRVENYFGGIREYAYIDSSLSAWSINMAPEAQNKISSGDVGNKYFGQGRDVFFVNMVGSKVSRDVGALSSKTSYNYYYYYNNRNWLSDPIDPSDLYCTSVNTFNPAGDSLYGTPDNKGTLFKYRNYKLELTTNSHQEYPDWQGHTKLFETMDFISDTNSLVKRTLYKYGNNISEGVSKCSFLDTAVVELINNIERRTDFVYGYFNTPFSNETYKNPVQSILQIDNFGLKTLVYNTFIYDSSAHYVNAKYKANSSLSYQEGDTTYFYLINQQTSKRIFTSSQSSPLYFDSIKYLSTNSDSGYMGQIILQRVYDVSDLSYFKDVNYAYYVRDTVGRFLYPVDDTKPSNEGKLKTVTDPRGNPVKYYYHPVYESEYQTDNLPGRPLIDFFVLYSKDTIVKERQNWEDIRMPVITQSFVNESSSLFLYNKYDPSGKITYAFNGNKYLNQLTYDSLERISQVNFPYDFGIPDTLITVDTVYENVDVDLKADLVSAYDFVNNTTEFFKKYDSTCSSLAEYNDIRYLFKLYVVDPGGPPSNVPPTITRKLPLIRFHNPGLFKSLTRINNATLKLYPRYFSRYSGGDTSLSKVNLFIKPLKEMYETSNSIVFTEAASNLGSYYSAFAFMSDLSSCTYNVENDFDITNMLNTHIYANYDSVVAFKIDAKAVNYPIDPPEQNYLMDFFPDYPSCTFQTWCPISSPILHISGVKKTINRDTILTYQNYSSKFTYNNNDKSVLTNLKYDNQSVGKRKTLFDGFYRVKQNRLYTSANDFDSTAVNYNYLSLKLNSKDGRGNLTKYSYNQYLNPSKTQNADASYSLVSETYYNGYTNTFGLVPGMVLKKVLTDEVGNNFDKFYDAVGNLIREIKYVEGIPSDNPEEQVIPLTTDYKYDDLYRVIEVKTPNEKHIYYTYDGLGRQSSRTTPDAGEVKYKYDKNDNLRFSQDNNQANKPTETPPSKFISYRGYDGLNRLLYLCDAYGETYLVPWSNLNADNTYYFDSYSYTPNNFLVINVYDSLTNYPANANIFGFHIPADYYTNAPYNTNNTKGSLCATAYRTVGTDSLSFKYYRYDARGRVIKMWNYIAGLGMKVTSYDYNSQNQLTKLEYQSESDTDYKRYIYFYDYAGRMLSVSTEESGPPPDYNYAFAVYKYNENSQVDSVFMNNFNQSLSYSFNNRNWITNCVNSSSIFDYSLDYAANGNIANQSMSGIYRNNFSNTKDIRSNFTYDKTNRLKKIEKYNSKYFDLTGDYSYDPDGNFTSLTRSYNSDNFSYDYYSGTNRLKKVTGLTDQYTYDYNGNQTNDYINNNTGIKYDHRNLITEFTRQDLTQDPPVTDITRYKYDEAGNRTRKTIYRSNNSNPPPLPEENEDLPTGWSITKDEYYSRDASGKEIAVYQSYNLDYWNVWGTGNEGRIKSTGMKYFYLKDHLGSIRAVINQNNVIVQAQDYDPWGHIARTWDSTSADYKFTGKEHDKESTYNYFGARYYDARIAYWGSIDPLFEKHIQWTPYNYVLRNPMALIDPDGRQIRFSNKPSIRNNEISLMLQTVSKAEGRLIKNAITENNGVHTVDAYSLSESIPNKMHLSFNFMRFMKIATSEQSVSINITSENIEFGYRKLGIENSMGERFSSMEAKGDKVGGFTLYSGKLKNPDNPNILSENGDNVALVNMEFGKEQAVISLAHEMYLHIFNYIIGASCTYEENNPTLIRERTIIEKEAKKHNEEWNK